MKKIFAVLMLLVFVSACASFPGSKWWYQAQADKYFLENPDRAEFQEAVRHSDVQEGMTEEEVRMAIGNQIYAPTIQEKSGYYQGVGYSSYFLVGSYKGGAEFPYFAAHTVIYFEEGICVGWDDI